jgi:hypothetical protein
MCGTATRGSIVQSWSKTYHAQKEHAGTWEISRLADGVTCDGTFSSLLRAPEIKVRL